MMFFMEDTQREHDISDEAWALIEPHLPGQTGQTGGYRKDNRLFLDAVFWILRTGASWRDLPESYGNWATVYRRFVRWREKRIWEDILEVLIDEPGFAWLITNASHAAGTGKGKRKKKTAKRGSAARYVWPWMRMVCQSDLLVQRIPQRIMAGLH